MSDNINNSTYDKRIDYLEKDILNLYKKINDFKVNFKYTIDNIVKDDIMEEVNKINYEFKEKILYKFKGNFERKVTENIFNELNKGLTKRIKELIISYFQNTFRKIED